MKLSEAMNQVPEVFPKKLLDLQAASGQDVSAAWVTPTSAAGGRSAKLSPPVPRARDGSMAGPGRRPSLLPPSPVSRRLSSRASGLKDRGTFVYKNKTREMYSANGQN